MYRIYGFPISNYYNMAKMALLEKGLPFEEVDVRPSQDGDWLARSPMGKVPCLETDDGFLCETQVILDYLEDAAPEQPLLPADAFARAKVRELSRTIELYVELPARRCFPEVFFGGAVSDETKEQVREALPKGIAAVDKLASFSPWIAGDSFSQADIMWHYSANLANRVARTLFDMDLMASLEGSRAHKEAMGARASAQRIAADQKASS